MKCPHCGKVITSKQVASAMGAITSEAKAASSADNGRNWQRPHFKKVDHFLGLKVLDGLVPNEWKFKVKLLDGSTYNPDFYHPATECYVEIATSLPNISAQRSKWRRAMKQIKLRVFWWEGKELTEKFSGLIRENGNKGGRPKTPSSGEAK